MAPAWPAVAALLALLAAGCSQPTAQREPGAGPAGPAHPTHLELMGCTGWDGRSLPFPRDAGPGQAPPGWEPKGPTPLASVMMGGYTCDRLSLGPFERGPVRFVFDAHDGADFPPTCLQAGGGHTDVEVLHSLWIDDADVAAYLRGALGLPARFASITETLEEAGPARLRTWSWGEGNARSSVTSLDDGTAARWIPSSRFFWPHDGGVGVLSLSYERNGTGHAGRAAHGALAPPMLAADLPGGLFLGVTKWYSSASAQGTLALFRDRACQEARP